MVDKNKNIENVLVLQGGGSLGAFGFGMFKAIANNGIRLDVIAGTFIGGINAAIIADSRDEKHLEKILEQFWLELSEGLEDLDHVKLPSSTFSSLPAFVGKLVVPSAYAYLYGLSPTDSSDQSTDYSSSKIDANEYAVRMKQLRSFSQFCDFRK